VILPALVALPVAVGPLLRGSWDIWAQSLIHLITIGGTTLWLLSRTAVGYIPRPSTRNLTWVAVLLVLGLLAVFTSPARGLTYGEWFNFLNALWLFPIMAVVTKDERMRVDTAIRIAAWILMVLAFYQRIQLGDARPSSALVNQNIYAGTILLLLPFAVEKRDWLLAGGLLINLWWAKSVGAWLGLSGALIITLRWRNAAGFWLGACGALLCSVLIYSKFQSPEVLNRWDWWQAAAQMVYDRPLSGYGPGTFAHALHSYRVGGGLSTQYAHQYFLQTAAEYGVLFAIIYFTGLWSCVMRGNSYKRFGALAILLHSFWDWSLSMPANLWLFSYFAASSLRTEERGVNVPLRWKLPVALTVTVVAGFFTVQAWGLWGADRAKARASLALAGGDLPTAARELVVAKRLAPADPNVHLLISEIHLRGAEKEPQVLHAAAASLEQAAQANPFRAWTWTTLEAVYRRMGDARRAHAARLRGAKWCARLRGSA
jgi:hypothetical protein